MVATNDDLLIELQKQTEILKDIKRILRKQYDDVNKVIDGVI